MAQVRRKSETSFNFNLLRNLLYGVREGFFLLFLAVALYFLMALAAHDARDRAWTHTDASQEVHNLTGMLGAWFSDIALYFIGYFAYALPLGLAWAGWRLFKRGAIGELDAEIVLLRFLGFVVALCAGCGLLYLYFGSSDISAVAGGVLGQFVGTHLLTAFGALGGGLFLLGLFLAGANLATGVPWLMVLDVVGKLALDTCNLLLLLPARLWQWGMGLAHRRLASRPAEPLPARSRKTPARAERIQPHLEPELIDEPSPPEPPLSLLAPPAKRQEPTVRAPAAPAAPAPAAPVAPAASPRPPRAAQPRQVEPPPTPPVEPGSLPPLDLLDLPTPQKAGYTDAVLEDMSRQVEVLLQHFNIKVDVVAVEPGPVITRFELAPAPGVKGAQIGALAKDLARGLSVSSVRVVDIIPGKSVIGLEIPNQYRETVFLREILDSAAYAQAEGPLTLALGKDISGNPITANLGRMPHLLVAGTTGSGKSVAVNAMLLSMLYKATPAELRLIMVDPKMLELSVYEGIPHLLAPVVTDMKEAANALRWCVGEMERRYRLMAALKVRNIAGFNQKVQTAIDHGAALLDPLADPADPDSVPATLEPLPFIVVVIDELADMMMIVGKKVEELIARLAQKARASGIHLILATQRPSVDVITGLIKANIPTRIAFQVSSKIDSRTILDQMGAEQLLGHGDMLYLPPGTGFPQRVHGAFVDDHEVMRVVDYVKKTGTPDYLDDILGDAGDILLPGEAATTDSGGESDPLYDQAVRIVTESRRASISNVQRRLKIGYNRAARLIEEMENAGIVGPQESNGNREVLAPPPPAHD